jgi:hypothetical protein
MPAAAMRNCWDGLSRPFFAGNKLHRAETAQAPECEIELHPAMVKIEGKLSVRASANAELAAGLHARANALKGLGDRAWGGEESIFHGTCFC